MHTHNTHIIQIFHRRHFVENILKMASEFIFTEDILHAEFPASAFIYAISNRNTDGKQLKKTS